MPRVTVGKWGKNLAIRVPSEIADATGLSEGEQVEFETRDGEYVIRRPEAIDRARAMAAVEEIIRMRREHPLRMTEAEIKEAIEEGRE